MSNRVAFEGALPWPQQRCESHARSSYLLATIAIVAALTALRLIGLRLSVVNLYADEAQYWAWSQDLALGYYSKPPLLAWIIAAATHVCGSDEWCVRAPAPLFYAATSLVAYGIGRRLYDERTGFWAALLTAFATGVVFSSRIISTDVPLLCCWAVSLWAYVNILAAPSKRWAAILGVSIGLGLLAKYAMIYFLPGIALAALFSKRARLVMARSEIWLALSLAALVVAPNVAWNVANSFATFQHTGGLVVGEPVQLSIVQGLEFLVAQFAVFGPVVFAVMIIAIVRLRSSELLEQDRILIAFFLPALAVVTAFAIAVKAYDNWAAVSFVSGAVLTAAVLSRQNARGWMRLCVAIGIVAQLILISGDAMANRLWLPYVGNPYHRTIGWREFAQAAGQMARQAQANTIASGSRSEFAVLRYYWRDRPEPVLWWRSAALPDFESKQALTAASREPILFVSGCPAVDQVVGSAYAEIKPLGPFAVPIARSPQSGERVFYGFRLSGARGPLPPLGGC
jgi:4-amino-4-deoxy-L-arabinose transferase-like glycosyltransferase